MKPNSNKIRTISNQIKFDLILLRSSPNQILLKIRSNLIWIGLGLVSIKSNPIRLMKSSLSQTQTKTNQIKSDLIWLKFNPNIWSN